MTSTHPISAQLSPISFTSVDPCRAPGWGQVRELVNGTATGNVPGFALSAGGLELSAGFLSDPQEHPNTDTVLLFTEGDPVWVFYGDDLRYLAVQEQGDLLSIRRGTPYAVSTGFDRGATGYVVRSDEYLFADTVIRSDLREVAQRHAAARRKNPSRTRSVNGSCTVVPFDSVDPVLTPQGHRIRPLVDGRHEADPSGTGISVGGLEVPAWFLAKAHMHPRTDVIVLVVDCGKEGALTLHGEYLEHDAVQYRGDLLPIKKGRKYAHTVQNLSPDKSIRAYEFRSQPTVLIDNPQIPELQPTATERGRAALERLHGADAVTAHLAQPPAQRAAQAASPTLPAHGAAPRVNLAQPGTDTRRRSAKTPTTSPVAGSPRRHQFIAGEWRDGSMNKVLVDRNPYDGTTVAEFRIAGVDDIDDAYRAAARARLEWDRVNPYAKRTVFERAVRYVEEHEDAIVEIIVDELGGTRLKAMFEIGLVLNMLKEAATFPLRMEGRILPSPIDDKENRVYREPVGVIGVISPFNFPFFLSMKSVAPALGAGNGVVLKPHEDSPITGGTLIGEIFEAAGLPAGLLNVVVTEIPAIGDAFLEHPAPRVISFTGSSAVGRHVAEVAVRHFKKPLLELGGNSAMIVLADADIDLAVNAAAFSRFTHQGQICMSANRILVHRDVCEEFTAKFVAKAKSLQVGDPRDSETILGPLIHQRQTAALAALVEQSIAEGATVALRGEVNGNLFGPTVLTDVTTAMSVMQQEMFGPVACLIPFDTEDEAIDIANDTDFGLSGAVHTRRLEHGVEIAKRLHTGMVHINDTTIHDEPIVPFGGEKQSGFGRLNGDRSLDEFTTLKWISVHRGRRQFPY